MAPAEHHFVDRIVHTSLPYRESLSPGHRGAVFTQVLSNATTGTGITDFYRKGSRTSQNPPEG